MRWWDWLVDVIFWIDILLYFKTGIVSEQNTEVVFTRSRVISAYMRGFFFPDLIATFPLHPTVKWLKPDVRTSVLRTLRLLQALRLLR